MINEDGTRSCSDCLEIAKEFPGKETLDKNRRIPIVSVQKGQIMGFVILQRDTNKVLYRSETATTVKEALEEAVANGATLTDAYLTGATLYGANLYGAKVDFFKILDAAATEVPALLTALRDGKVDGSTYQGECACLIGTIANVRHCDYRELGIDLRPDSSRPAERLFLAIKKGSTPTNNPVAKIVEGWVEEWQAKVQP